MAQRRGSEDADGGATQPALGVGTPHLDDPSAWQRGRSRPAGWSISAALVALLAYVTLCALVVWADRAVKGQQQAERAEEERRRWLRRWPPSIVDETEAVLVRAYGRRWTR